MVLLRAVCDGYAKDHRKVTQIASYLDEPERITKFVKACGKLHVHFNLHSPKPGRLSLSYDVQEFHRAALTEGVFGFAGKRSFERDDFELDAHGLSDLKIRWRGRSPPWL